MPKGARNVFLNETEDSRNVLGESLQVCTWWTSMKEETLLFLETYYSFLIETVAFH